MSNFSQWQDVSCESESLADVHVDGTQIPLTKKEDGEEVLRMFWLDAYEDYFKQPGTMMVNDIRKRNSTFQLFYFEIF